MKTALRRARVWWFAACLLGGAGPGAVGSALAGPADPNSDHGFPRALDLIPGAPEFAEPVAASNPLELAFQTTGSDFGGSSGQRFGLGASWRNAFRLDGKLDLSRNASLEFKTRVIDRHDRLGAGDEHFDVVQLLEWERNTLSDTEIKLSLFGDRLRFTTRHGVSNNGVSRQADGLDSYFDDPRDPVADWREPGRVAQALVQRVDASLWRSQAVRVSAFGVYRNVDEAFERRTGAERRARQKSPFGAADRRSWRGGFGVKSGPFGLKLMATSSEDGISGSSEERGPRERGYRADASVSLDRLRSAAGDLAPLVPGSLWMSFAKGTVRPGGDHDGAEDATRDLSAGFSWDGSGSSISLGAWHSYYDGRQLGSEESDWVGSGIDLSLGFYRERWDLYADASLGRYRDLDPWSETAEASFDVGVVAAYRPERLPELAAVLSWNRYRTDYLNWEDFSLSDSWSAQASLDFSKYLNALAGAGKPPALRAAYRFERTATSAGNARSDVGIDHAAILSVELHF
jgi:hypothetical protein